MIVRRYGPEDGPTWLRFLNLARGRSWSVEEFEERERAWPASEFRVRLVGVAANSTVAIGQIAFSPFVPQDHVGALLFVAEGHRLTGRGQIILERLRQEARAANYRGIMCDLGEDQAEPIGWLQKRGFSIYARRFESVLDLNRIDLENHRRNIESLERSGVRFASLGEDPARWNEVLRFFRERLSEAPDMEGLPPWEIERCRTVLQTDPNASPDWIMFAERHGAVAGMAVMHRRGDEAYLFFEGVSPAARGQGIAPALVAQLVTRARSEGYRAVRINNLDRNAAALRVNGKLGFVRQPGRVELRSILE